MTIWKRGSFAFSVLIFLALTFATNAADQPKAVEQAAGISSEQAVVKDIVYGLDEHEGKFSLTSQPLNGNDREVKRVQLDFSIPQDARVVELGLEKLDGKNLMAVVKLEHGGKFEFHCLTFIAPTGGHVRESFAFHQARFHATTDNLKILALGGRHINGSAFIVLGNITSKTKTFETVTEGVFYFSNCPWPPSDGALTPFHVESPPIVLQK